MKKFLAFFTALLAPKIAPKPLVLGGLQVLLDSGKKIHFIRVGVKKLVYLEPWAEIFPVGEQIAFIENGHFTVIRPQDIALARFIDNALTLQLTKGGVIQFRIY